MTRSGRLALGNDICDHYVNANVNVKCQCQSRIFSVAKMLNYCVDHEGVVWSKHNVRKRLVKKKCFQAVTEDRQRGRCLDVGWQWVPNEWCSDWKWLSADSVLAGMMAWAVGVTMQTEFGEDWTGRRHELADSAMVARDHVAPGTPWQPPWSQHVVLDADGAELQGVGDMVVTTYSKYQTSRRVENRLKAPL